MSQPDEPAANPSQGTPCEPRPAAERAAGIGDSAAIIRSEELLRGHREALIVHCQEVYRLRLTRNGKLILTK